MTDFIPKEGVCLLSPDSGCFCKMLRAPQRIAFSCDRKYCLLNSATMAVSDWMKGKNSLPDSPFLFRYLSYQRFEGLELTNSFGCSDANEFVAISVASIFTITNKINPRIVQVHKNQEQNFLEFYKEQKAPSVS